MTFPSFTQPDMWWLSLPNAGLHQERSGLHLMTTDLPQPFPVDNIDLGDSEEHVKVTCIGNKFFNLALSRFKAVDKLFLPLEQLLNSRQRFLAKYETILKDVLPPEDIILPNETVIIIPEKLTETEVPRVCNRSFQEEVELMRTLHPGRLAESNDFLDSSNRKWRQQCTELLKCTDRATFGGRYREAIYCSCLPACCFNQLCHVFLAFNNGTLESVRPMKTLKAGLFTSFVGVREEMPVHRLLSRLATGLLSVEDFRKEAKALKDNKEKKTKSSEEELLEENSNLKREISQLRKENADLKRKLRNQAVFEFDDNEDQDPTVHRTIAEIHDEPQHQQNKRICNRENQFNNLIQQIRQVAEQPEINEEHESEITEINEEHEMEITENNEEQLVTYSKGEKVMAKWEEEWLEAIITRVYKNKGYGIRYTVDNFKMTVTEELLKKI